MRHTAIIIALCACAIPFGRANAGDETQDDAIDLAKATLSEKFRASESDFELVSAEPINWTDSGPRCRPAVAKGEPAPDSGYRVKLDWGGSTFTVHVGGGRAKICGFEPVELSLRAGSVTPELAGPVEAAKADLAERLDVDPQSIQVLEATNVTWRDSSAGCPREGMSYLQVLTPGVRILLQAAKKTYHYHGSGGGEPVLCERPKEGSFIRPETE